MRAHHPGSEGGRLPKYGTQTPFKVVFLRTHHLLRKHSEKISTTPYLRYAPEYPNFRFPPLRMVSYKEGEQKNYNPCSATLP